VCWIYSWTRRLTVPAGACSCMHCGEAQGDTMEACVHRMLYCSAVQSSVDSFSQDFGLKLNWKHHGIRLGVFYSVSRMER
jgi:hypothetical protein